MDPEDFDTDDEALTPDAPASEEVTLGEEPASDIIENDDGSTTLVLDDATDRDEAPEFYANLADSLEETDLAAIADYVMERVDLDIEARKKRDEDYAEALRRTGLDGNPEGGADFEGASKVVVPLVMEACVDFSARAIKELFPLGGPDGGPAKMSIIGKPTVEKVERARRKAKFLNWQLTQQMPAFREELEQNLSQVPMAGAGYLKLYWDQAKGRPDSIYIPHEEVIIAASATSFLSAERKTHKQTLTGIEFDRRVETGFYRDIRDTVVGEPERTSAQEASDAIDGLDEQTENLDGVRTVYEVQILLEVEEDTSTGGELAPYLVSIDEPTGKVVALYRNWSEDDPNREAFEHIIDFPFIPWRGAYPLSLPQMVGGLETAARGALNALLDSAHISNMPGGFYLKGTGATRGGQNIELKPGEYVPLDGGVGTDQDIRKTIMAAPVNQPSPVLFQLLGFLQEQARGVVQTTFEKLADQNPNAPVGTTLALIEQGMTVFSAIHARLHQSMGRVLQVLHRLNRLYLKDTMTVRELGELIVKREDFEGPSDIVPVSDPNIFSEAQRMAQTQMIAQRAAAMPMLYDLRKVELMLLERSKIPDADKLLIEVPTPQRLNAVNENVAASMGKPLVAFPDQDHVAHLRTHLDYMQSPMFGGFMLIAPGLIPQMLTHLKDHIVYWYVSTVVEMGSAAAGTDISKLIDDDPEVERALEGLLSDLSSRVLRAAPQALGELQIPAVVQQAIGMMQQLQQMSQPQMTDPAQVAMAETQRKAARDQMDAQEAQAKLAIEQKKVAIDEVEAETERAKVTADLGMEAQRQLADAQQAVEEAARDEATTAATVSADILKNREDNQTAKDIAAARIMAGQAPQVENGNGLDMNPTPEG